LQREREREREREIQTKKPCYSIENEEAKITTERRKY
jgi:hypothetical protein